MALPTRRAAVGCRAAVPWPGFLTMSGKGEEYSPPKRTGQSQASPSSLPSSRPFVSGFKLPLLNIFPLAITGGSLLLYHYSTSPSPSSASWRFSFFWPSFQPRLSLVPARPSPSLVARCASPSSSSPSAPSSPLAEALRADSSSAKPRQASYSPAQVACVQLAANKQLEDRVIVCDIADQHDKQVALLAAVCDGHGGPAVADLVARALPVYIEQALRDSAKGGPTTFDANAAPASPHASTPTDATTTASSSSSSSSTDNSPAVLATAARRAFLALDKDVMDLICPHGQHDRPECNKIGACCLSVMVTGTHLVVANVGDCKAVLVKKQMKNGVLALNKEHTSNCPEERRRLRELHPDEPDVVVCKRTWKEACLPSSPIMAPLGWLGLLGHEEKSSGCYVKGRLQPTHSFGDFYLKNEMFAFSKPKQRYVVKSFCHPFHRIRPTIQCPRHRHPLSYILNLIYKTFKDR
eukprot:GHVT01040353.1.p1 GENE.GHVT01040353.1~~GHVT01040353.1.p1  ORF type:complete len:466 (+),score=90.98 GHVT01040353.1:95-1492(+)